MQQQVQETICKQHGLRHHLHELSHDLRYELEYMLQELHGSQLHLERFTMGDLKYNHRIEDMRHHRRFQLELACAIRGYHQTQLALHLEEQPSLE